MGRFFAFVRQFFTIILFVVLQIVALSMLYSYSASHKAVFSTVANQVTGSINKRFYKVQDYLHLNEVNKNLSQHNLSLLQKQKENYVNIGNTTKDFYDTLFIDTTGKPFVKLLYSWKDAKVVYQSLFKEKNYIQLARGVNGGLKKDMGVVSESGAVAGRIVEVSGDYSTAMSVLHKDFNLQGKVKRTDHTGWIKWDGKDYRYINLEKVPKDIVLYKGDSIVTYGSEAFPDNTPIAVVDTAYIEKTTNYLKVKLRTITNFGALSYAYIVENNEAAALKEQLKKAQNQ
jgi:rod shape-determining protein MreC